VVTANDTFNYLAVLFSIIIGLAVTELLQNTRDLVISRRQVKLYWPAALRAATLLLVLAQTWWAIFGLRTHTVWTFGMYAAVLTQIVLLYLTASLALPNAARDNAIDMRVAYFGHAGPSYGLLVAAAIASVLKDLVLDAHLPDSANLTFHAAFIAIALLSAFSRSDKIHRATTLAMFSAFVGYVIVLFDRLPGS
jgi:glycopeptide antibiotics resistance protein